MLEALELDLAAAELTPGNSDPFVDSDKATWFSGAGKQRRRSYGNGSAFRKRGTYISGPLSGVLR